MRRSSWWVGAAGALAAGGLASTLVTAACQSGDCSINGCPSNATCTLVSGAAVCKPNPVTMMGTGTGTGTGTGGDAGDGGFGYGPPPKFVPGDGGPCTSAAGAAPTSTCDPSDETTCSSASGCVIAPQCNAGSADCEAFVQNKGGVDNFRMRYIGITAPTTLATTFVEGEVVTAAVDLPAPDGGTCGENGSGLFNWLISVDHATGVVKTGGAPQSTDPFNTGYCYFHAQAGTSAVGPVFMQATFTGNTFSTQPVPGVLNIPIFQKPDDYADVVILPINGASFTDVTVSDDGNCIGTVDNESIAPGVCTATTPSGPGSCSRWHTAGALTGYITLAQADTVPITLINGESLCVLLTGDTNGASPPKCTAAGMTAGDYCSTTHSGAPGNCGDSFWLSALFSASAVIVNDGAGIPVCAPVDAGLGTGDAGSDSGTGSGSGSGSGTGTGTGTGSGT